MAKLVRLKPLDKKKGHVIHRYTAFQTTFEEDKGWYRVPDHVASYLATVHMSLNNGLQATGLPVSGIFSGFGAALTEAGASCAGALLTGVTPNPISAPLPFSIK